MDIAAVANMAAVAAAAPAAAVAPALAPDALAAARFSEVMNAQPAAVAQAIQQAFPAADAQPRTLGDSILSGMQGISNDLQQSWRSVNTALEGGNLMSMTEMLRLQLGIVQMSVQYDLVGKAISRSTQTVDQLVKMQ